MANRLLTQLPDDQGLNGIQSPAKPTHILVTHRSQDASILFRAEDGILTAMHQNAVVVFGDNPQNKNSHTFLDKEHAAKWLREVYPSMDLKERGIEGIPVLETRDGEAHGLYVPDGSLELPGMGPHISKRTN